MFYSDVAICRHTCTQTHTRAHLQYIHLHTNKHSLMLIPNRDINPVKYTVFCSGRAERMKSLLTQCSYQHHMIFFNAAESSRALITPNAHSRPYSMSGPLLNTSLNAIPLPVQWLHTSS